MKKLLAKNCAQRGFTLIELMIVLSLAVMLLLGAASMFMTFLLSNNKVGRIQTVKFEGDRALNQISFLLRNATQLLENSAGQTCELGMSEIRFQSWDGGVTTLLAEEDEGDDNIVKIASNSGTYLTSGGVEVSQDLTFNCTQSVDGRRKYVEVVFGLQQGSLGVDLARDIVEQEFRTGVALRN